MAPSLPPAPKLPDLCHCLELDEGAVGAHDGGCCCALSTFGPVGTLAPSNCEESDVEIPRGRVGAIKVGDVGGLVTLLWPCDRLDFGARGAEGVRETCGVGSRASGLALGPFGMTPASSTRSIFGPVGGASFGPVGALGGAALAVEADGAFGAAAFCFIAFGSVGGGAFHTFHPKGGTCIAGGGDDGRDSCGSLVFCDSLGFSRRSSQRSVAAEWVDGRRKAEKVRFSSLGGRPTAEDGASAGLCGRDVEGVVEELLALRDSLRKGDRSLLVYLS